MMVAETEIIIIIIIIKKNNHQIAQPRISRFSTQAKVKLKIKKVGFVILLQLQS